MSVIKFKQLVLKRRRALSAYRMASYALNVARRKNYQQFWVRLEADVKYALDELGDADIMLDRFKPWRDAIKAHMERPVWSVLPQQDNVPSMIPDVLIRQNDTTAPTANEIANKLKARLSANLPAARDTVARWEARQPGESYEAMMDRKYGR